MAVLERLKAKVGFTRSEVELADYILEHADDVAQMGIADLAQASYKSNATIIRLCRKTGVSGWREFRIELVADMVKDRSTERSADPNSPFLVDSSTASIMASIMQLEQQAASDCYLGVSRKSIGCLARACTQARRVIYYALGDTYATLYGFGGLMSKIGVCCVAADQYRFRHEAAYHVNQSDLVLIATYSGKLLPELNKQVKRIRAQHCRIAVISSDPTILDAEAPYDYPVLLPPRENKFGKIGTFYSQSCMRYVLNCVYSVAFSQNYDSNLHNKDQIEMLEPGLR